MVNEMLVNRSRLVVGTTNAKDAAAVAPSVQVRMERVMRLARDG